MGNAEFHPASDHQLCGFNAKIFTEAFPELATIFWSSVFGALFYLLLIGFVVKAKIRALKSADSSAAAAVVLPSYLPLLYLGLGSAITQVLVALAYGTLCDSSFLDQRPWLSGLNPLNPILFAVFVLSYDWFSGTVAALFFMRSISKQSFLRASFVGLMLGSISAVISGFAIDYVQYGGGLRRRFEYLLMIVAQTLQVVVILSLAFCRPGRRSSCKPFLVHSLLWRLAQIAAYVYSLSVSSEPHPPPIWTVLVIQVIRTTLLPPIVYWTLLLDTWYWRGVPRRKRLSAHALRRVTIGTSETPESAFTHPEAAGPLGRWLAQPRYPPRDPANDRLQQLLDDASDLIIDHAFLSIDYDTLLGRGASASVFHGTLTLLWGGPGSRFIPGFSVSGSALFAADPTETRARSVEVAVKIYTPPELDEAAILAIKEETSAWGELSKIAMRSAYQSHVEHEDEEDQGMVIVNRRPPNLVRFFGMCVMPPHLSLVFEYCEGGALSEWIGASSAPPLLETRIKLVYDCALSVYFLHSNGFIHRDLKAANYLLKRGCALLTDFGTCLSIEADDNQRTFFCTTSGAGASISTTMTTTVELKNAVIRGTTVGTIDHMAPELLVDMKDSITGEPSGRLYSSASDIYALAVTVASVIAYRHPFLGMREWDVRERVVKGERPFDLDDFVFKHDSGIREWLRRAFLGNPIERPTALDLVELCEARLSSTQSKGMG